MNTSVVRYRSSDEVTWGVCCGGFLQQNQKVQAQTTLVKSFTHLLWRLIATSSDRPDLLCNGCFLLDTGDRWLPITFPLGRVMRTVCVPVEVHEANQLDRQLREWTSQHAAGSRGRCLPEAAENPECWRCVEPEAAAVKPLVADELPQRGLHRFHPGEFNLKGVVHPHSDNYN